MGLISWLFGSKKTPQKSAPKEKKAPPAPHQPPKPESNWEAAKVKKVILQRGIAFVELKDGRDVYVHKSTLKRCKVDDLKEGQMVEIKWGWAKKGLEASELRRVK